MFMSIVIFKNKIVSNRFKRCTHVKNECEIIEKLIRNNCEFVSYIFESKRNNVIFSHRFCFSFVNFGLGKVLSYRTLSTNLKIQMYMTLIRPIVLYASETWPLRKVEETGLKENPVKNVWPMHRHTQVNGVKRHNEELEELFQRPNVANEIKKRRLSGQDMHYV
ncbi:ribosome biogenesis protein TSR3 isoform X1 [Aphis craccivora]|uniref:Ribosome biogenesis protein TSR3 isoform X1 n=1 Tax=Aphis craccivora TaxID=307492 RepID=A0A6G0YU01_APHCR|nr:ribosome biogenesis protein TSR3 isoform X1 [Aphis craccivora]